ncbi:hypothetical protein X890_503 [Burkholderia pseudomallei MSHR4299]|nr:hypothetical protein X890_503 [Burkholderia pseudomallei MSHR4299]
MPKASRAPIDERRHKPHKRLNRHKRRGQTRRGERTSEMTIRLKARVSIAQCGAIGFARGGRHRATPQKTHRPLARRRRPSQAAARRIPIRGKIHGEASRDTAQDFAFAMIPAPERFSTRRVRSRRAPFAAAVHDEAIRPSPCARGRPMTGPCAARARRRRRSNRRHRHAGGFDERALDPRASMQWTRIDRLKTHARRRSLTPSSPCLARQINGDRSMRISKF